MECKQLSNHKENQCDHKEESIKNSRTIANRTNLFNHINNLTGGSNVRASSTMIKVTYNKGTKSPTLQTLDGENEFMRMNNKETIIPLNAPVLSKKKSFHFEGSINSGKSEHLTGNKILRGKEERPVFKGKNSSVNNFFTDIKCQERKEPNKGKEAGFDNVGYQEKTKVKKIEERKNIEICQKNSLMKAEATSIGPSKDSSNGDTLLRNETDPAGEKGNGDGYASNILNYLPDNCRTSLKSDDGNGRKSGGDQDSNDVVESNAVDSAQTNTNESEAQTPDDSLESEIESKADTISNFARKVKKRKSESAAEEEENKKPAKQMRRSIVDEEKEILFDDQDLPPGWQRFIHTRKSGTSGGQNDVHILSPNGKIFRFRGALKKYLEDEKLPYSIDNFYFGLYKRKSDLKEDLPSRKNSDSQKHCKKTSSTELLKSRKLLKNSDKERNRKDLSTSKSTKSEKKGEAGKSEEDSNAGTTNFRGSEENRSLDGGGSLLDENGKPDDDRIKPRYRYSHPPMRVDPDLPEGWHRSIKVRSTGESAGRMEVIINSPDGKKHRNKGALEQYLKQNKLPFPIDDFDFTLFGKSFKRPIGEVKRTPKFRPSFHLNTKESPKEKETTLSPEALMIGNVSGTMLTCGITTVRNERRTRISKAEQEKNLKELVESSNLTETDDESSDIPAKWIRNLTRCRTEFASLQQNAESAIASATKEFLQQLALQALKGSERPENGLEYDDVASLVEKSECLSCLKPLIPKRITFKEFIKLNRPKKFSSFT